MNHDRTQAEVEEMETARDLEMDAEVNDQRYRKLRAWMSTFGGFQSRVPVFGEYLNGPVLVGPTFDAAVDALPEPDSSHGAEG